MFNWISENFYIIAPTALIYLVLMIGVFESVHWLRRRFNITGVYAWSCALILLELQRNFQDFETAMPHTVSRTIFMSLVIATFFSLILSRPSDEVFTKIIGREEKNLEPQSLFTRCSCLERCQKTLPLQ